MSEHAGFLRLKFTRGIAGHDPQTGKVFAYETGEIADVAREFAVPWIAAGTAALTVEEVRAAPPSAFCPTCGSEAIYETVDGPRECGVCFRPVLM